MNESDVLLFLFLGGMAVVSAIIVVGGLAFLLIWGCQLADRLGIGCRVRHWFEIRAEIREAERILRRCQELDLSLDEVLELEAANSRVD